MWLNQLTLPGCLVNHESHYQAVGGVGHGSHYSLYIGRGSGHLSILSPHSTKS